MKRKLGKWHKDAGSPPPAEPSAAKPNLLDYLESLPEVEDPFEPSAPSPAPEEKTALLQLADRIRMCSARGCLLSRSELASGDETAAAHLAELDEARRAEGGENPFSDIRTEQGAKDLYYYSTPTMAVNYAHMAMLALEKDYCRTIADTVRWHCKVGPSCTWVRYFTFAPYNLTMVQIDRTLKMMKQKEAYADIQETASFNGKRYLYSSNLLTAKYAKALADFSEEGEENM